MSSPFFYTWLPRWIERDQWQMAYREIRIARNKPCRFIDIAMFRPDGSFGIASFRREGDR